jgi:membrane-bound serine protease (ClpP class)
MHSGTFSRLRFLFAALVSLLYFGVCLGQGPVREGHSNLVVYLEIRGAIGPASSDFLLRALEHAAMASATSLGAATPVQIGGGPAGKPESVDEEKGTEPATVAERKAVNDAVSFIRGLAELRDRNAAWAEAAVREAASLTASVALERNVIDVIAFPWL